MAMVEPDKLRRWQIDTSDGGVARFFTCARPGRSSGPKVWVTDRVVSSWVCGLPGPATAMASLLGRKQGKFGASEFSYYSFIGGFDKTSAQGRQPSFQEWLESHHAQRGIMVREHPTCDYRPITYDQLTAIEWDIRRLILAGRIVAVMDSGGRDAHWKGMPPYEGDSGALSAFASRSSSRIRARCLLSPAQTSLSSESLSIPELRSQRFSKQ